MMPSLNPPGNMICILAAHVFTRLGNTPVVFSPQLFPLGSPLAKSHQL